MTYPVLGWQNRGGWALSLLRSSVSPRQGFSLLLTSPPPPLPPPAREGVTCDLLGKIYLNGESFQPTCKLQCICMDGAIGCIPLCSDDLRLPSPECPTPRRVKFHNKCCEEWVCEEGSEDNPFGTATAGQWGTWDGAGSCFLGKRGGFGALTGLGLGMALCIIMMGVSTKCWLPELNTRSGPPSCSITPLPSWTRGSVRTVSGWAV